MVMTHPSLSPQPGDLGEFTGIEGRIESCLSIVQEQVLNFCNLIQHTTFYMLVDIIGIAQT